MANLFTDAFYKVTTGKTATQIESEWNAANETLARLNADLLARGRISQADSAVMDAHLADLPNIDGETTDAFLQGAKEGLAAEQAAVKGTLSGFVGNALAFVPWWLWFVAAAWLAFQLGLIRIPRRA